MRPSHPLNVTGPLPLLAVALALTLLVMAREDVPRPSNTVIAPPPTPPTQTAPSEPPGPAADNSRCFVCHANYDFKDEQLALTHAKANVGCVKCHGESSRHSADEDGFTPPDRMFPKSHIRFNCLGCHDWMKLVDSDKSRQDRSDPEDRPDHQSVLDATARKKLCTDCHGDHRLGHRTRVWDKRTGILLRRDATPAMLRDPQS
ncbi:MAG TPA: cytochrome c3 family protein [Candidatus Paceibacterota bacterium]|nr:cytochrome c3 family protein [Candidatus Paceibacterota bacterium]HRZ54598.1 cytochrome c3 family protein [Candidatus Paceibacterota bacterium]